MKREGKIVSKLVNINTNILSNLDKKLIEYPDLSRNKALEIGISNILKKEKESSIFFENNHKFKKKNSSIRMTDFINNYLKKISSEYGMTKSKIIEISLLSFLDNKNKNIILQKCVENKEKHIYKSQSFSIHENLWKEIGYLAKRKKMTKSALIDVAIKTFLKNDKLHRFLEKVF